MNAAWLLLFLLAGVLAGRALPAGSLLASRLSRVTISGLLPALLLLRLLDLAPVDDVSIGLLAAFYAPTLVLFGAAALLLRCVLRLPARRAVVGALGACFGNVVLTGIPVVDALLGPVASLPMLLIISLHSLSLMPLGAAALALVSGGSRHGSALRAALRAALGNPIVLGILAGFALHLLAVDVPLALRAGLATLAAAAGPAAMLVVGLTLARLGGERSRLEAPAIVAMKCVLHPLLVLAAGLALGLPWSPDLAVAVLLAGQPTGVNVVIFAGADIAARSLASRVVLGSTLLAMLAGLPLAWWWLA